MYKRKYMNRVCCSRLKGCGYGQFHFRPESVLQPADNTKPGYLRKIFLLLDQRSHQVMDPSWRYFNQNSAVLGIDDYVCFKKKCLWSKNVNREVISDPDSGMWMCQAKITVLIHIYRRAECAVTESLPDKIFQIFCHFTTKYLMS